MLEMVLQIIFFDQTNLMRIVEWYEVSNVNRIPSINWPPLCHTLLVNGRDEWFWRLPSLDVSLDDFL
jgi:hypothetical protein